MIFKQKQITLNDSEIEALSKKIGLSFLSTKILANRGFTSEESAKKFLSPSLNQLYNPFLLKDMDILVKKINDAILTQKRVLIFGDYDVDGISATAILYKYFEKHNLKVDYFLPNRYEDGYGLTMETAQKVIDIFNPQLIITVDCGISCAKEIDFLQKKGIDIVVTDHHELPEVLPNCPIVNAKQTNQQYPFKELCGAGVALKIVQALGEPLDEYLPICAIATIADIVTLTDENRVIVSFGLKLLDKLPIGVKTLLNELKIKNFTSSDIAFKVAPKINAAGRMGDASIALKLYITTDKQEIKQNLALLGEMNLKRQELCNVIYNDAIEILKQEKHNKNRSIILFSDKWDSGLLGIVCARLTDEFNKPTFLFSEVDGLLKGSVRSIADINIHEALSQTSTLLETFGGHSMAAGLTLKKDNLQIFKQEIENYFYNNFKNEHFVAVKEYDLLIEPHNITIDFIKELDKLEPFGCCNPKPIFYSKFSNLKISQMKNFPQHLNITTKDNFSLLAFNSLHHKDLLENSFVTESSYELQLNKFKNNTYLKGLVKNIKCTGFTDKINNFVEGNYLLQLKNNKKEKKNYFYSYEDLDYTLNKLTKKSNYGTLIICNNLQNAKKLNKFLLQNNYEFHVSSINTNSSNNAIIVGLSNFNNLSSYDNFVFLEPLLHMDYLNNFKGNLYLPKNHNIDISNLNLNLSHDYYSIIYKKLVSIASKINAQNKYGFYINFKAVNPDLKKLTYAQFIACLQVFIELNFINENISENTYSLEIVQNPQKNELKNSHFYTRLLKLLNKGN